MRFFMRYIVGILMFAAFSFSAAPQADAKNLVKFKCIRYLKGKAQTGHDYVFVYTASEAESKAVRKAKMNGKKIDATRCSLGK